VCESSVSFYKLVRILAIGEGSPFGEGAPLLERSRPFGRGHVHFDLVGEKGRAPFAEGAPLWKRALSKCLIENLTY
jgi:hypothetical protein